MASGDASTAEKILDNVLMTLTQYGMAETVTRDAMAAGLQDPQFDKFPFVWIRRGEEKVVEYEHGMSQRSELTIILSCGVRSENAERQLEQLIKTNRDALMDDIRRNNLASMTYEDGITEPEFVEGFGLCDMRFKIQYQFTVGNA